LQGRLRKAVAIVEFCIDGCDKRTGAQEDKESPLSEAVARKYSED
jgi:hypothetical protein